MAKSTLVGAGLLLVVNLSMANAAMAQPTPAPEPKQSVLVSAETREFSDDRGSLRSFTIEYKRAHGGTTVLLAPTIGERRTAGADDTALGIRGTLYHDWSPAISTRTSLFVAEDTPVFAHIDAAQDVTFRVADGVTLTPGVRWAEYSGDREAAFYSLGARRYFSRGSIAYRLTRTQAEDQDGFFAHLLSASLNDGQGKGKTQLWLSSGDAALTSPQTDEGFDGSNRAFVLQRTQPLWGDVALIASAGLASYEFAGGRYTAATFGIGVSAALD